MTHPCHSYSLPENEVVLFDASLAALVQQARSELLRLLVAVFDRVPDYDNVFAERCRDRLDT